MEVLKTSIHPFVCTKVTYTVDGIAENPYVSYLSPTYCSTSSVLRTTVNNVDFHLVWCAIGDMLGLTLEASPDVNLISTMH